MFDISELVRQQNLYITELLDATDQLERRIAELKQANTQALLNNASLKDRLVLLQEQLDATRAAKQKLTDEASRLLASTHPALELGDA